MGLNPKAVKNSLRDEFSKASTFISQNKFCLHLNSNIIATTMIITQNLHYFNFDFQDTSIIQSRMMYIRLTVCLQLKISFKLNRLTLLIREYRYWSCSCFKLFYWGVGPNPLVY